MRMRPDRAHIDIVPRPQLMHTAPRHVAETVPFGTFTQSFRNTFVCVTISRSNPMKQRNITRSRARNTKLFSKDIQHVEQLMLFDGSLRTGEIMKKVI